MTGAVGLDTTTGTVFAITTVGWAEVVYMEPLSAGVVTLEQEDMPETIKAITSIIPMIVALFISSPIDVLSSVKRSPATKGLPACPVAYRTLFLFLQNNFPCSRRAIQINLCIRQ